MRCYEKLKFLWCLCKRRGQAWFHTYADIIAWLPCQLIILVHYGTHAMSSTRALVAWQYDLQDINSSS
jgi:hypothetical protein